MSRNKFQKEKTSLGHAKACHHHPLPHGRMLPWKSQRMVSTKMCAVVTAQRGQHKSQTQPLPDGEHNLGCPLVWTSITWDRNWFQISMNYTWGNGHLSVNIFPWWQALGCRHVTREQSCFYVLCSFLPPLVLLERMPVACCHLDFLYPIIIHWILSSLLWSTQHSSHRQSKLFFFFFWAITTVVGSGDKPVSKYILNILCILNALSTNNVKIALKLAWIINTCYLPKQEVWG